MKKQFYLLLCLVLIQTGAHSQGFLPPYIPDWGNTIAWYPFENNTLDYSGNFRDLANSGVTFGPDRFGIPNSAAYFDGSDYLFHPSFPSSLSYGKKYTISLWVKPDDVLTNSYRSILQLGSRTTALNDDCIARMYQFANTILAYNDYTPQVDHSVECSAPLHNTNWVHLQIEWDGAYFILLKDGQFVMQEPAANVNSDAGQFFLGAYGFVGQSPGSFFRGYIDDVVVFYSAWPLCYSEEMYRSCGIYYTPVDITATVGDTVFYSANNDCYVETGLSYQWKMDNGTGFQNLSNAGQFSGTNTQVLTISNVTQANNNTRYACTISGNCDPETTDAVWLNVIQPNGLQNIEDAGNISLSPNPVSSHVSLSVSEGFLNKKYRIFNSLGERVIENKLVAQQTTVDLSALSNGIYMVQIEGYKPKQLVLNR